MAKKSMSEFLRKIKSAIFSRAKMGGPRKKFPCEIYAPELIINATVIEDVPLSIPNKELEFISFLEPGETSIEGGVMYQRAVGLKANIGLSDGKYLLEHQWLIPAELRGKHIVLSGTLLGYPEGTIVPYLSWRDRRWWIYLYGFRWLDNEWNGNDCLVRCK